MKPLSSASVFNDAQVSLRVERLALAAILLIALFVRFYAIEVPTIWYDEAYSLLLARETPARIWVLTSFDVHPPLYYILLHYWGMVWGDSALPARAFSALADVGTMLLCIKLMSLVATRRATWIAALLLALLPISVRYSQEVRMYTLLGFWLMGATVALVCWAGKPDNKRFAVIYVVLMTAAFYTHYFAGLCVLVHWLFWWQSRGGRRGAAIAAGPWLIANIAIAFMYLPWIPFFLNQLGGADRLEWIEPVTAQQALILVWQFTVMGSDRFELFMWQLAPLAVMVLCSATVLKSMPGGRHFGVLLIGYFFIPLIALYLISLSLALFVPRYLVFTAPALAMVIAVALDAWSQRRPLWVSTALVLSIVGQLHGLTEVYRQTDGLNGTSARSNTGFFQLLTKLNHITRPGDEIIIANAYWYPTFAYYSTSSINPKFEVRSSMDSFLRFSSRGALSLINDPVASSYIEGVTVLGCSSQRIWWVTDRDLTVDPPLFAEGRTPSLTLHGTTISAYLFTSDSVSASVEADERSALTPPPHPAAQNCPPAPSATSANKTRRSLRH